MQRISVSAIFNSSFLILLPVANRSLAREIVSQTVFECEFRGAPERRRDFFEKNLAELKPKSFDHKFAEALLAAVFERLPEIKQKIAEYAPEWPYEKIARLDRAVLECGLAELLFLSEIPPAVTLNEFVEIAKNYGGESARKFVNGVLSAVKKTLDKKAC